MRQKLNCHITDHSFGDLQSRLTASEVMTRRDERTGHPTMVPDKQRINKLISRIYILVQNLTKYRRDLTIHRAIDQYHLIQKAEELRLLYEAFEMTRIDQSSMEQHYRQVYLRWRQDVRRMHAYGLLPLKK